MEGIWRQVKANLRTHRLQSGMILLILSLATAVLTMGVTLLRSTSAGNPWDRVFTESRGAHVWFTSRDARVDLTPIGALEGVSQESGPYPYVWGHYLVQGHTKYELGLYGMQPGLVPMGQPMVTDGAWLSPGGENEIVLDRGLARALKIEVGNLVVVQTTAGETTLIVAGLAVNPAQGPYPYVQPGLGYALPATLAALEPDRQYWQWKLGIRLKDPKAIPEFLQRAESVFPSGAIASTSDWRQARDSWVRNASNPAFNLWLGFFGVFALVAVGFVIANGIGGVVLSQYREIGLLKAVGLTPVQVALIFLLEYLGIGLVAGLIGLGLGTAIAPFFLRAAAELLNVPPIPAFDPLTYVLILVSVELIVALFTWLPAWNGGRISTVQALTTGFTRVHREPSWLAGLSSRLRLPPFITLGLKDTFTRPLRAWLTIAALVLTVSTMVFMLVGVDSIQKIVSLAIPYDMTIQRGFLSDTEARQILDERPDIRAYYSDAPISANLAVQGTTIKALALAGAYGGFIHIAEGRLFSGPDEAVVTRGLMALAGTKIGGMLHLTVNGRPLDLRIVGRYADVGSEANVAVFSLDTLNQVDPGARPTNYYLKLAPGTAPKALETDLIRLSNDRFNVTIIDLDKIMGKGGMMAINYGVDGIVLVIGVVSLFITTWLGVRERRRDFGIFKTAGLTPGQIVGSVISGACPLALLAVSISIPLGVWMVRILAAYLDRSAGSSAAVVSLPAWWWFALMFPVVLLLTVLGSLIPAWRAAAVKVVEVLRYE